MSISKLAVAGTEYHINRTKDCIFPSSKHAAIHKIELSTKVMIVCFYQVQQEQVFGKVA